MDSKKVTDQFQGEVLFRGVYLIECSKEDAPYIRKSHAPLAIRPMISFDNHTAQWETNTYDPYGEYIAWDSVKSEITIPVEKERSSEPDFVVVEGGPEDITISKENHLLRLRKLTRALFDEKVRPYVTGGKSLSFGSDADLQNYFLKAHFQK